MHQTLAKNAPTPAVNDRIECNEEFGTIKYIGPVHGQVDIWLGIDWDNPERGKHNGSVDGLYYFSTRYLKSGSFVRPQKVNFGQSLVRAITSRYGSKDDELSAKINNQKLLKLQQEINAPFVEMVGFDDITKKQSDLKKLEIVFARMQNVSRISEDVHLGDLCPSIRELDVSKNLLSNWDAVFTICTQLIELEWLNLSENYLQPLEIVADDCFCTVKTLICGTMRLTWNDLVRLSEVFPGLQELRAPYNNITDLNTPPENNFHRLKILDLEGNPIVEWSEICKLAAIPSLEQLILDNIGLKTIRFEQCENQGLNTFRNLKKLSLSNNLIEDWQSVGELNKLKNLEDLKFLRNPILESETPATRHQIVVAKLATLKTLNSALIETNERKGAELDYLKKYGLEWLSVRNTTKQEEFLERHNRYLELIQEYGPINEDELKVPENNVSTTLVEIVFQCRDKQIKRKIPRTILIQKLVVLVEKLFGLSGKPTLLYVCTKQPDIHVELSDEGKELSWCAVEDGDKIYVVT